MTIFVQSTRSPARPGSFVCAALCAGGLLLGSAASAGSNASDGDGDGDGWQLRLRSAHHSDASDLARSGDLEATDLTPREGRNLAYIDDEARLSRSTGPWTWSLLARTRATLVVSQDTLDLYRQVESDVPAQTSRRWQTSGQLRGFSGAGLALARTHELGGGWRADWSVQWLALRQWRERRVEGPVNFDADTGTYAFALQSSQLDTRLDFPFQTDYASLGAGLLGSGGVSWQGDNWRAGASVQDAGWLRWRGIPRQDAVLDTATSSVDEDGYLIYRPLVQGQNSQANATRSAPWWATLDAAWRLPAGTAQAGADWLPGFGALPWLGWQQAVGSALGALQWRTHERRLTLMWQWRGLQLQAGADRLGDAMQSRELALSWRLPIR